MRQRMTITPLTSPEQLAQLEPWLKSFDHKSIVNPIGRFHLFTKMARVLALTQQATVNALFPAINPKVCTPRETTEIADCFHSWNANTPGGLMVAVPDGSPMHAQMEVLGYQPYATLYEPIPVQSP